MGKPDWKFTKGLHEIGNGCFAYLQPDGGWGWSNAGLVTDGSASLLTAATIMYFSLGPGLLVGLVLTATLLGPSAWRTRA